MTRSAWRAACCGRLGIVGYVTVALFAFAAGGLFVSTLTENAIAAMATTIGIAIFSALLDAVPHFRDPSGILLTDHWLGFGEFLLQLESTTHSAPFAGAHCTSAYVRDTWRGRDRPP